MLLRCGSILQRLGRHEACFAAAQHGHQPSLAAAGEGCRAEALKGEGGAHGELQLGKRALIQNRLRIWFPVMLPEIR
jgi:hypothetical protein